MRTHSYRNDRHQSNRQGSIYRGKPARVTPLPEMGKHTHRCECGKPYTPNAKGLIPTHRTVVSKVPCIHSRTPAP